MIDEKDSELCGSEPIISEQLLPATSQWSSLSFHLPKENTCVDLEALSLVPQINKNEPAIPSSTPEIEAQGISF